MLLRELKLLDCRSVLLSLSLLLLLSSLLLGRPTDGAAAPMWRALLVLLRGTETASSASKLASAFTWCGD